MTHEWEKLYEAAMLETDWSRMEERIEAAESALHARLDEMPLDYGGSLEENRAIADALNRLDTRQREVARWKSKPRV
jgi:hypothetical protein